MSGPRKKIVPEINVTPLVDVVLVLLIIFMVVAPQLDEGPRITMPKAAFPDEKSKAKLEPLTIGLTAVGEVYIEKDRIERSQFRETLKARHESAPQRRILVKADRGARFADVRDVFRDCQDLGFSGVALQVEQVKRAID